MTASSLRYLIKEGLKNTWINRMMSIASICVLLSCLVLIGSASMIFLNINAIVDRVEAENVIMVFIESETTPEDIDAMGTQLKELQNVDKVEFVPKQTAWEQQLHTMDEASRKLFTDISSDIPLPDAYKVTVKDLTQFKDTVRKIKALSHIEIVRENSNLAKKLATISRGISVIATIIIAVLFAISLFIIANTIKLTVYSRRLEISIMKSVGATNSFVRLPFVVEGILIGLISGVVSLGAVWGVYDLSVANFNDLFESIGVQPLLFTNYIWHMLGAFVAIGVISGVGGSLITMRRYLNKEGSEISAI